MDRTARSGDGGFRPDVEGMRALAVIAVLLCHAGLAPFAGGYVGVDVFFVISGFLITRLLLAELGRTGTVSLPGFYARRARRLLPQTALLLGTVAVASLVLFSPLRALAVSGDLVSSALYTANWHFGAQSVDYFSQGQEPSPVLHLWSLAIEEQFYLVWPTLLFVVASAARRLGRPVRPAIAVVLLALCGGSLLLGVGLTEAQPVSAYFSTIGRAWELGLGATLALLGTLALPRPVALAVGWAGLAAILHAALAYDGLTPFPGLAALLPTAGAAALILAGASLGSRLAWSPAWLLSLAPVRYLGRISYSWYLWHWPALVFAAALLGPLSPATGLAAVLASLLPTVLSHHLIEDPVRRARSLAGLPRRSLALGLGCTAAALAAGLALAAAQPSFETAPLSKSFGAGALASQRQPQEFAAALRPNPVQARRDRGRIVADGCLAGIDSTRSGGCGYGDPNGGETVVLFGDSHAMQYFPALAGPARRHGWRLVVLTKRECPPAEATIENEISGGAYSQCDAWRERSLRRIERLPPGATVVVAGAAGYLAHDEEGEPLRGAANAARLEAGYVATLHRLQAAGHATMLIRDLPGSPRDVPSCVAEHLRHLRACAFARQPRPNREFDARAATAVPGTVLLDLTPEVCPRDLCRAVIGNVLVYRDRFHLTAAFARTLGPWLERALLATIEPRGPGPALASIANALPLY